MHIGHFLSEDIVKLSCSETEKGVQLVFCCVPYWQSNYLELGAGGKMNSVWVQDKSKILILAPGDKQLRSTFSYSFGQYVITDSLWQ